MIDKDKIYLDSIEKLTNDKTVRNVISKINERSNIGIIKYGTTLEQNKSDIQYWLKHLQEELFDAALYIQKLIESETSKTCENCKVKMNETCNFCSNCGKEI